MIDIMDISQSYESRQISEIPWISESNNPADSMTKSNSNKAQSSLIETNELEIQMEGFVQRNSKFIGTRRKLPSVATVAAGLSEQCIR